MEIKLQKCEQGWGAYKMYGCKNFTCSSVSRCAYFLFCPLHCFFRFVLINIQTINKTMHHTVTKLVYNGGNQGSKQTT